MSDTELKKALKAVELPQLLPLVVEIMPGQAAEGLIDIYEPGSYEGKTLRKLCDRTLSKKKWTIEEQLIIEDINRQLAGGKLLCRGQEIEGTALEYAVTEETEAGEKYLYVPIRAIKPQEGGHRQHQLVSNRTPGFVTTSWGRVASYPQAAAATGVFRQRIGFALKDPGVFAWPQDRRGK